MSLSVLDQLWDLHLNPNKQAPTSLIESNISIGEGQDIQLELLNRWLERGEEIGGWKIGMTSGASRNAMGDGIRPFGFILKSRINSSETMLPLEQLQNGGVENEVCFDFKTRLSNNTSPAQAKNAVNTIYPAFEINQKRLPQSAQSGLRVADNLSNWGIVHGSEAGAEIEINSIQVTLSHNGKEIERTDSKGHIDDHYESIATLANNLSQYGHSIEAGQKIITGAFGKTPFREGVFHGSFSHNIGSVTVELVK